jgi:hypothetical protein
MINKLSNMRMIIKHGGRNIILKINHKKNQNLKGSMMIHKPNLRNLKETRKRIRLVKVKSKIKIKKEKVKAKEKANDLKHDLG